MDISEIGIAISVISVSVAVLKQNFNGKKPTNGCYVKRDECHSAMDAINQRLDDSHKALDTRISDLIGKVDLVVDLIKNGK